MQRILVATDGSEGGDRAVDYAANLAKIHGAELVIVNVMGQNFSEKVFERFTHAQQDWLNELLQSMSAETLTLARQRASALGVATIRSESRIGDVAQTIMDVAAEKSTDVIVVGKRGTGRLAGLLLGSVSQKLASLAPIPVTVVP